MYDFPTITQKFFQYARECTKASLKREASVETGVTESEITASRTPSWPAFTKKRSSSPLSWNGKAARKSLDSERRSPAANGVRHSGGLARPAPQPNNATIHVGWLIQQHHDFFSLEKDFRSLRTWFAGPEQLQYNYDEIRRSLRIADDPQLKLF